MKFNFFLYKFLRKHKKIKQWLNAQSFPSDAILYLIEKEIYENGNRDLSYIIPRYRNDEYFKSIGLFCVNNETSTNYDNYNEGIFGDYTPNIKDNSKTSTAASHITKATLKSEIKPTQTIERAPMPEVIPINHIFEKNKNQSQLYDSHPSSIYLADSEFTDISDVDLSCYDD